MVRGIGRALKAGDMEAAQYLIQKGAAPRDRREPSSGSWARGMQNVVTGGVKQPCPVRRQARRSRRCDATAEGQPIRLRERRNGAASAPLCAADACNRPGAIVGGALSGLAMPTDNPDVLREVDRGGIGAATGGVPAEGHADAAAGAQCRARPGLRVDDRFFPGARQEIAGARVRGCDTQGERSAVKRSPCASYAPPNKAAGIPADDGESGRGIHRSLADGRHLREAGGAMGQPELRDMIGGPGASSRIRACAGGFGGQAAPAAAAREAFSAGRRRRARVKACPWQSFRRLRPGAAGFRPERGKQQAGWVRERKAIRAVEQQILRCASLRRPIPAT